MAKAGFLTTRVIINPFSAKKADNKIMSAKVSKRFQFKLCYAEISKTTLLTPSFGNCLFAYHHVLKHFKQNVIISSFCIPKVLKSAT